MPNYLYILMLLFYLNQKKPYKLNFHTQKASTLGFEQMFLTKYDKKREAHSIDIDT